MSRPSRTALTAADIRWGLSAEEPEVSGSILDLLEVALVEAQSYRVLAQQALHVLHGVQLERDVLRGQRLLDRRRDRERTA